MSIFDYHNPAHIKARKYRTRAIMAALFAQESKRPEDTAVWAFVAESWTNLADLTERSGDSSPRSKPVTISAGAVPHLP